MKVTVQDLAGRKELLAGRNGAGREITSPRLAVPELSVPGSWRDVKATVVHLSPAQLRYLATVPATKRAQLLRSFFAKGPAAIVVTGGAVPEELLARANLSKIPVFRSRSLHRLEKGLSERLSPRISLHGVLVQIFGLGTLILGESAIGKSEAALDLVLRGHKLVADDVVILERSDGSITGCASELGADLLQIRGLGIINMRALYGESATVQSCRLGLVVELEEWKKGHQYSLVGLRERRYRLFSINVPYLKLPVKSGRNIATLIEVAARNQMLKNRGIYTARDLHRKLTKRLTG